MDDVKFAAAILLLTVAALAGPAPIARAKSLPLLAAVDTYLDSAEIVVAAEIASIDDSATATDGPRTLTVRILAVAKGKVRVGQTLRVGEAAQLAGNYRLGERRLLMLNQPTSPQQHRRRAEWWNIPTGLEITIEPSALEEFTFEAIQEWVRRLAAAEHTAPAVEVRLVDRSDSNLELIITLTNPGSEVIEFEPSEVRTSFDAVGRRYMPEIKWNTPGTDAWFELKPGRRVSGSMLVEQILPALRLDPSALVKRPDGTLCLPLTLGHRSLRFPATRAWIGYATLEVPLRP
jgi:hypothetical protein